MSATVIPLPLSGSMAEAGLATHLDGNKAFLSAVRPGDDVKPLEVDLAPVRRKLFLDALEITRKLSANAHEAVKHAAAIAAAVLAWITRMIVGLARRLGYALQPRMDGGQQHQAAAESVAAHDNYTDNTTDVATRKVPAANRAEAEDDEGWRGGPKSNPFAALAVRSDDAEARSQIQGAAASLANRAVDNGTVATIAKTAVRRGLGRVAIDEDLSSEMLEAAKELAAEEQAAIADVVSKAEEPASTEDLEAVASAEALLAEVAEPNFVELRDELLAAVRRRCLAEAELYEVIRGVTSSVGVPLDRLAWSEMVEELGTDRCRSALEAAQIPVEKVHAALVAREQSNERELELMTAVAGLGHLIEEHGESPAQIKAAQALVAKLNDEINQIRVEVLGLEAADVIPEGVVSVAGAKAAIAEGMGAIEEVSQQAEDTAEAREGRQDAFAKLVQRGV